MKQHPINGLYQSWQTAHTVGGKLVWALGVNDDE
jgi:hypothetical protein